MNLNWNEERARMLHDADSMSQRYMERIRRQHDALSRLLDHHARVHPECDWSDGDITLAVADTGGLSDD